MITLNENGTLKYVSSGLFQSDGSWIHPRVTIETYEIIFMYEGTAYICEDGTEYILHPDDVLILDPDREHYGFRVSEEYVSFSWLHFKTSCDRYKNLPKHFHSSNPAMPKTLFSQCMHIADIVFVISEMLGNEAHRQILFDIQIYIFLHLRGKVVL